MDEFIYICYSFDTKLSGDIVQSCLAAIDTHADSESGPLAQDIRGSLLLSDSEEPITVTIGGLDYDLGVGSPALGNFDDEQTVWIRVFGTHFQAPTAGAEAARDNTSALISLVTAIYETLVEQDYPVSYVYGFGPTEVQMLLDGAVDVPAAQLAGSSVEALFWLQILPPSRVSVLGEDRLLSAPAWRVEQVSDDGILLVVYDTPDPWVDGDSSRLDEVMDHLELEDPYE